MTQLLWEGLGLPFLPEPALSPNFPHRIYLSVPQAYTRTPGGCLDSEPTLILQLRHAEKGYTAAKELWQPLNWPTHLLSGCAFQLDSCFWSISELHCSYASAEPHSLLIQTLNLSHKCDYLVWPQTSPIIMDLLMVTGLWLTLVTTTTPETVSYLSNSCPGFAS